MAFVPLAGVRLMSDQQQEDGNKPADEMREGVEGSSQPRQETEPADETLPAGEDGGPVLILASASPRRLALLEQVGLKPDLLTPVDIDETPRKRELPRDYVRRMAFEKLEAAKNLPQVKGIYAPRYLLAADTTVAVGRRILGKVEEPEEAREHLHLLSGRSHRVYTAICLLTPQGRLRRKLVETKVRFKRLSREEVEAYIASNEWRGKAGAYALQGLAAAFVRQLNGSCSGVIGLPVHEVVQMLAGNGFPVHTRWLLKEPPPPLL